MSKQIRSLSDLRDMVWVVQIIFLKYSFHCLFPDALSCIVKRHDLSLFSSVKMGILKGEITYTVINTECTLNCKHVGLGIVHFLI